MAAAFQKLSATPFEVTSVKDRGLFTDEDDKPQNVWSPGETASPIATYSNNNSRLLQGAMVPAACIHDAPVPGTEIEMQQALSTAAENMGMSLYMYKYIYI